MGQVCCLFVGKDICLEGRKEGRKEGRSDVKPLRKGHKTAEITSELNDLGGNVDVDAQVKVMIIRGQALKKDMRMIDR
jgi:hypothetical protein